MTAAVARPGRRMPSAARIAEYWEDRFADGSGPFVVDWGEPSCFGCDRMVRAFSTRYLERAHLVDRCRDGLDGEQNLVLLCGLCHALMPSFGPGEGDEALAWVLRGGATPTIIMRVRAMGLGDELSADDLRDAVHAVIAQLGVEVGLRRAAEVGGG